MSTDNNEAYALTMRYGKNHSTPSFVRLVAFLDFSTEQAKLASIKQVMQIACTHGTYDTNPVVERRRDLEHLELHEAALKLRQESQYEIANAWAEHFKATFGSDALRDTLQTLMTESFLPQGDKHE